MGILHKAESKSKPKIRQNTNEPIADDIININKPPTNIKSNNININSNKIKNNIGIENINEPVSINKSNNGKNDKINNTNKNTIPVKIERKDLTPSKRVINNPNNKQTTNKDKSAQEIKTPILNNNDDKYKKLKEIENNLANLNNLGKNISNKNNESEKNNIINNHINKNPSSYAKIQNNKNYAIDNEQKYDLNKNNKTNNNNVIKNKNQGSGLNINYGIFEENKFDKFDEEPKFNVFYEKHDTPYNSHLNDDDYINVNKYAKDKLKLQKYDNINNPPSSQQRNRINDNGIFNNNINNKNNPTEKGK